MVNGIDDGLILNKDGRELILVYGTYDEYLRSIKIENSNKRQHRMFATLTAILAILSIILTGWNLYITTENTSIARVRAQQQNSSTFEIYKGLLRQNDKILDAKLRLDTLGNH